MKLLSLVAQLDEEFNGKKGLFGKIDSAKCGEIIRQIKFEASRCDAVMKSRETVIQNADTVAQNVIAEAKERADFIAGEDEIVRLAEIKSRKIIDEAYRECDALIQKTKDHLDAMFSNAEDFFSKFLMALRSNRNELRNIIFKSVN